MKMNVGGIDRALRAIVELETSVKLLPTADAYYALGAFRLLGHFEEREQFLHYLLNIASSAPDLDLAPLYRIDGRSDLGEQILPDWPGFRGEKPVRVGNGAALHKQHDVFGEMVLALTPMFLDARFRDHVTPAVLELLRGVVVAHGRCRG
mgnify:CR=1 FL=1